MASEIWVALIGLGGSAMGSVIGVLASARLTQYRLEQLEKKVDKHNSVIERTYRLEEDMKLVHRRMEELERSA